MCVTVPAPAMSVALPDQSVQAITTLFWSVLLLELFTHRAVAWPEMIVLVNVGQLGTGMPAKKLVWPGLMTKPPMTTGGMICAHPVPGSCVT